MATEKQRMEQLIHDLEGAGRMKDAQIETLKNMQCQCLPVVERERDELRKEVTQLRATVAKQRQRMYSAAQMLIEDLDEDQCHALLDRLNKVANRG